MDRTTLLLGALGLIGAMIGTLNVIAFRKYGRIGHLICAGTVWLLISAPVLRSLFKQSVDSDVSASWLIGNGVAVAMATIPLWFFRQEVSNRVLFGVTTTVAFVVGWLYIAFPWLAACFLFGRCDP